MSKMIKKDDLIRRICEEKCFCEPEECSYKHGSKKKYCPEVERICGMKTYEVDNEG